MRAFKTSVGTGSDVSSNSCCSSRSLQGLQRLHYDSELGQKGAVQATSDRAHSGL